jgi:prepilin-type N-terminal cleavage/methylation domain-containing protein
MHKRQRGFTIIELIVTLAVVAVALTIAALNLRPLGNDLQNATSEVASGFRQLRTKAISTTSAYRFVYISPTKLAAQWSKSCSATSGWTSDSKLNIELRNSVKFTQLPEDILANSPLVCYTPKGLATNNVTVKLRDEKGTIRSVEVFLGGGIEVK